VLSKHNEILQYEKCSNEDRPLTLAIKNGHIHSLIYLSLNGKNRITSLSDPRTGTGRLECKIVYNNIIL